MNVLLQHFSTINKYLRCSLDPLPVASDDVSPNPLPAVHYTRPRRDPPGTFFPAPRRRSRLPQVEFEEGDPRNPINFSPAKKWGITITACGFTGITGQFLSVSTHAHYQLPFQAAAISSYTMGVPTMVDDLHCSLFEATVGLSVYPLGFSLVPLFTSSLSEEYGRFRLYIVTVFFFMLTHVMIALRVVLHSIFAACAN